MSYRTNASNAQLVYLLGFIGIVLLGSCKSVAPIISKKEMSITRKIDPKAQLLYEKIQAVAKKGYAFGHQDATAYGINWKHNGNPDLYRSDVKDVAGDHPAVHGFEIGHIELGNQFNLDTVSFALMKSLIKKTHAKGAIITISWHPDNPASNRSSWHTRKAVKHIIKGGKFHKKYKTWLSRLAIFMNELYDDSGKPIPIIFRPFHEMNGSWFWWGKGHCSPEEYKLLWRETVQILQNEFKLTQLLYAYSPNTFTDKAEYLTYYPGDDFVDILGVDIYQHWTTASFIKDLNSNIPIVGEIAVAKNKPYALTEAGLNKLKVKNWWTEVLDKNIANTGISWALFWRNARKSHFFGPYPGQKNSEDFKLLKSKSHVLFLKDLENITVEETP
ncbi:glycoside hydrolase family 26 protein [Spongiimicrobium salis]|uniref:glycoside hydrolase family 26 protein n=1 Tax=Spongiimicrobium salis TaxID=1667022 RepID=UPI00374DC55D